MDLNQQKLSKREWDTTELPVCPDEKEILTLIIKGYHDVNIMYNKNMSMISFMKLEPNENIKDYLYTEYFEKVIEKFVGKYELDFDSSLSNNLRRVNSMEKLKLENMRKTINDCGKKIFEFYLLHIAEKMLRYYYKDNMDKFNKHYYTLYHLRNVHITNIIPKVNEFIDAIFRQCSNNLV